MTDLLSPFSLARRKLIGAGAFGLANALLPSANSQESSAVIEDGTESYGLSTFGDLEQPADFKYFNYVNPKAPKGGVLALSPSSPTFDTFNAYVLRGNPATGMSLVFDTLMNQSLDERDAYYGLVARSA